MSGVCTCRHGWLCPGCTAARQAPALAQATLLPVTAKPTNPKDACGVNRVPASTVSHAVIAEVGLAMLEGARKYGRHNYRAAGVRASVYLDAVYRHLFLQWWEKGEDIDAESGLSHVTKAIAGLIVLRDSMMLGNWDDDRPPRQTGLDVKALNAKAGEINESVQPNGPEEPWTEERVRKAGAA